MLGIKPWEFKLCEVSDILDLYDGYKYRLLAGHENKIQAQLNDGLHLIAHTVAVKGSNTRKPYDKKPSDFLFKPKTDLRKEAEEFINGND